MRTHKGQISLIILHHKE